MSCGSHLQKEKNDSQQENDILNLLITLVETNSRVLKIFIDIKANFSDVMLAEVENFLGLRMVFQKTLKSVIGNSSYMSDNTLAALVALNEKCESTGKKQDVLYERLSSFCKVMHETKANWEDKYVPPRPELEGKSITEMKDLLKFWKDQESNAIHGRSAFEDLKAEWDAAELGKAFMECIQEVTNLKDSMSPSVV